MAQDTWTVVENRKGSKHETGVLPSAAHDLRAIEGEGVGFVGFRPHLIGLCENRIGEKLILLKVEL